MAITTTELVIINPPALLHRVHNNTVPNINRISKDVSGDTIPQITLDITQKVLSTGKFFLNQFFIERLTSACLQMSLARELALASDIWFIVLRYILLKFKLSHPGFKILSSSQSNDFSFYLVPFGKNHHDDGQSKHQLGLSCLRIRYLLLLK